MIVLWKQNIYDEWEQRLCDENFPIFLSHINLHIYLIKLQVISSELISKNVLI